MGVVLQQWIRALTALIASCTEGLRHDEQGSGVIEWMAIGALSVAAIVVINGALTHLGLDIVDWARGQLGVSG